VNPDEGPLDAPALTLKTEMTLPQDVLNSVTDSIALARRMRPEMNQARLQIAHDDLEVVRTRNGLLPQLDLFATWGKNLARTSYSALLTAATQQDVRDSHYSTEIGAQFSYPIGNRAARAQHERAKLGRTASGHALANLAQLVEQDVRSAHIEVSRANEQITATAATRKLQEETLNSEREKYRLGKSTILLVTQAQRDLLQAQINEVQAKTAYVKAVVGLYHVEGSLLERRGVMCPGGESNVEAEAQPQKG
jgi:outer membrane protein TolC